MEALMDPYVMIATKAIDKYVKTSRKLFLEEVEEGLDQDTLYDLIESRAGAFVSIHRHGDLRGCIGTIGATADNLFEEVVHSAISACSSDPRFYPVREEELAELEIKVDRLYPPEPIESLDELDVVKYGVIVEKDYRRGLLLPNLEGVDTVEYQVAIAMKKAGIDDYAGVKMFRFEVERQE